MKDEKLMSLMDKLTQKRAEIDQREKLLREKERNLKIRRFIEVGTIAAKFGIEAFDDETLVGAFAELQERSKQADAKDRWKQMGTALSTNRNSPLIILFGKDPSEAVKASLKGKRFKWNTFRKEWQGFGIKEEIEEMVKDFEGKVEVAKG